MIGRRLVALALATALLPLNVLRADATCTHREQAATPPAAEHDDHHPVLPHHDVADTTPAPDGQAAPGMPCDHPTQAECCQAMASCASGVEVASETATAVLAASHDAAVAVFSAMPSSRVTTPDPPPPKA